MTMLFFAMPMAIPTTISSAIANVNQNRGLWLDGRLIRQSATGKDVDGLKPAAGHFSRIDLRPRLLKPAPRLRLKCRSVAPWVSHLPGGRGH